MLLLLRELLHANVLSLSRFFHSAFYFYRMSPIQFVRLLFYSLSLPQPFCILCVWPSRGHETPLELSPLTCLHKRPQYRPRETVRGRFQLIECSFHSSWIRSPPVCVFCRMQTTYTWETPALLFSVTVADDDEVFSLLHLIIPHTINDLSSHFIHTHSLSRHFDVIITKCRRPLRRSFFRVRSPLNEAWNRYKWLCLP